MKALTSKKASVIAIGDQQIDDLTFKTSQFREKRSAIENELNIDGLTYTYVW